MFEKIRSLPRFLLETMRGARKTFLLSEARFLYENNARIMQNHYDFSSTTPKKHKIIVSLTTHQRRIEYLHFVFDSLYSQFLRPDEIRLYVTKKEYQTLPFVLEKFYPWLLIIEVDDIGSYKKFIPALQTLQQNEVLISLDDDFIYPPHLISSLYSLFLKEQNALIGYCGFKNGGDFFNGIAGGMGILWNPKIINPQTMPFFFQKELFWDSCQKSLDDAWIVLSMLEMGISIFCLSDRYYEARREYIALPSEKIDSISASNQGKNYINAQEKERLKKKLKELIVKHCKSKISQVCNP